MSDLSHRRPGGRVAAAVAAAAVIMLAAPAAQAFAADAAPVAAEQRSGVPAAFDEIYQSRHIVGHPTQDGGFVAFIDGRQLHLQPFADGSWTTNLSAYEQFATPLEATRAAVEYLRGADPT